MDEETAANIHDICDTLSEFNLLSYCWLTIVYVHVLAWIVAAHQVHVLLIIAVCPTIALCTDSRKMTLNHCTSASQYREQLWNARESRRHDVKAQLGEHMLSRFGEISSRLISDEQLPIVSIR